MSVCARGSADEDSSLSGDEGPAAGAAPDALRELRRQKPPSTPLRVLTVLAYLLSVSLAAILLSVYYIYVWKSPELPPLEEEESAVADHPRTEHLVALYPALGDLRGGDSTVKVNSTPTDSANLTSAGGTDYDASAPSTHLPATDQYTDTDTSVASTATEGVVPSTTHPAETLNITDVT